ncbi:hypothetical protein KIN20_030241 [Parelaphostrongylus tenuis]|uniref:Uncharacterized protein n=1 Tax=Parelaphostrongylus tenuis TaxID=148309 RepID=A0AAD5WG64_PARTN|nr:hypothetical protein KIN20_030241 [Parelaphostrongylus tenuis]
MIVFDDIYSMMKPSYDAQHRTYISGPSPEYNVMNSTSYCVSDGPRIRYTFPVICPRIL